ncbi:MAG TPA: lipase family protein [Jatrophihabitans sp.]|nr:lipase family protein [Jatrophihabitans sp.]
MLAQLQHPTGTLAAALAANDVSCDWTPRVPVHLYVAHSDQDVAVQNSYLCQQQLTDHGAADVSLIDLGHLQHLESGKAGFAAALQWFGQIAPPTR